MIAKCQNCGREFFVELWPVTCACGVKYAAPGEVVELPAPAVRETAPQGLGDWTEQGLKRIGVTPERYVAAKKLFGLRPTCNCLGRREWLNKVSEWWAGQA